MTQHTPRDEGQDDVATTSTTTDRWKALDFAAPRADATEPDSPVLIDYLSGDRIAVITLNRPHADNAITNRDGHPADRDRREHRRLGYPDETGELPPM